MAWAMDFLRSHTPLPHATTSATIAHNKHSMRVAPQRTKKKQRETAPRRVRSRVTALTHPRHVLAKHSRAGGGIINVLSRKEVLAQAQGSQIDGGANRPTQSAGRVKPGGADKVGGCTARTVWDPPRVVRQVPRRHRLHHRCYLRGRGARASGGTRARHVGSRRNLVRQHQSGSPTGGDITKKQQQQRSGMTVGTPCCRVP